MLGAALLYSRKYDEAIEHPYRIEVVNSLGKEERSRELIAEGVHGAGRPDDLSEVRSVLVLLRFRSGFSSAR